MKRPNIKDKKYLCQNYKGEDDVNWLLYADDLDTHIDTLMEDSMFLAALETAGVDNWDGYEYAQEIMDNWVEENKLL